MDCSPPGSSVHGIFQARILDPVFLDLPDPEVIPLSPSSPTLAGGFFTVVSLGKPFMHNVYCHSVVSDSL